MASTLRTEPLGRPEAGQILIVIRKSTILLLERHLIKVIIQPTYFNSDDFSARSSDELTLSKGDRVELIERDDDFGDGWYLGRHLTTGASGLFPEGRSLRFAILRCMNTKPL